MVACALAFHLINSIGALRAPLIPLCVAEVVNFGAIGWVCARDREHGHELLHVWSLCKSAQRAVAA